MIQSGKLDRRIELQRLVETVNDYGELTSTWTTYATVRAALRQRSAREFLQAFGDSETAHVLFTIRYVAGLTTADRVLFEGGANNIKEVVEIGRRRGFELRCEASK